MQVYVRASGKTFTVTIPKTCATLNDLRCQLEDKVGIPRENQRLTTTTGKLLRDGFSFEDFDIRHESTIHLNTVRRPTLAGCPEIGSSNFRDIVFCQRTGKLLKAEVLNALQLLGKISVVEQSFIKEKRIDIVGFRKCLNLLIDVPCDDEVNLAASNVSKKLVDAVKACFDEAKSGDEDILFLFSLLLFHSFPLSYFPSSASYSSVQSMRTTSESQTGLLDAVCEVLKLKRDLFQDYVRRLPMHMLKGCLLSTVFCHLRPEMSTSTNELTPRTLLLFDLLSQIFATHGPQIDIKAFQCNELERFTGPDLLKIEQSNQLSTKYPFLFTEATVQKLFQAHISNQKSLAVSQSTRSSLRFQIDREHLIQHSMTLLDEMEAAANFKLPIKLTFLHEPGIDQGGLKREYFQLLSRQVLDPKFGMFALCGSDSEFLWFSKDCTWTSTDFQRIGLLMGLALYNEATLDISFPSIFYTKLLQQRDPMEEDDDCDVCLESIQELDPALKCGLGALLSFEPAADVEHVFCRSFQVAWTDAIGLQRTYDLVPNGADVAVTGDNRKDFVRRYCHWLVNESVEPQFAAFLRGFSRVIPKHLLHLLKPHQLERLMAGPRSFALRDLKQRIVYEGWDCVRRHRRDGSDDDDAEGEEEEEEELDDPSTHPTIVALWHALDSLSPEEQRRFLMFVTGSMRPPVNGLASMRVTVQRAGPDSLNLPSSHTCFNTLLLPDYSSGEKLRERLLRALQECEGFGLS